MFLDLKELILLSYKPKKDATNSVMLDRNPFSGTSTIGFAAAIFVFGDFGALVFFPTSGVFFAFFFKGVGVVAFGFRPLRFGDFVSENSEAVGEGVEDTGESLLAMQY